MNLFYNGIDILENKNVILSSCLATDNATGEADSLKMIFSDFSDVWSKWNPSFGDVVEAVKDGWTTGKMYIDEIVYTDTSFILNSRSLPPKSRTAENTVWENIRFSKIALDLATLSDLELEAYDIIDYEYVRFDRKQESPIKALNKLCMLEGYCLKITNGKAVIYNEKLFESSAAVTKVEPKKYNFIASDIGRSKVNIKWVDSFGELIQGSYSDTLINVENETITTIPVYNVAQAERWCKGMLRQYNKNRITGKITIDQNLSLAASNVVEVSNRGNFFITNIQHELIGSRSNLSLRKPIVGDY